MDPGPVLVHSLRVQCGVCWALVLGFWRRKSEMIFKGSLISMYTVELHSGAIVTIFVRDHGNPNPSVRAWERDVTFDRV